MTQNKAQNQPKEKLLPEQKQQIKSFFGEHFIRLFIQTMQKK